MTDVFYIIWLKKKYNIIKQNNIKENHNIMWTYSN